MHKGSTGLWILVLALGCPSSYELDTDVVLDGSVELPPDGFVPPVDPPTCMDDLDLLVVIDDTVDAFAVQRRLADALPDFLSSLVGGDDPLFRSVHVGVVSPDLGTAGFEVGSCRTSRYGDDGLLDPLRSSGCLEAPPFVALRPDAVDAPLECLLDRGAEGCGWEQPLEAALKAVTSSESSLRFLDGTFGHADRNNAGFLRVGAMLAVIVASNEDDCSARDPNALDPFSPHYPESLPTRCWLREDALHPTRRYVDGLLDARDPNDVAFLALGGLPRGAESMSPADALARPDMQLRVNDVTPDRPRPACNDEEVEAYPARRLALVTDGLARRGARALLRSVCRPRYDEPLDELRTAIAHRVSACR
jgi:hypothetical protein